jgi:hypothetical protein
MSMSKSTAMNERIDKALLHVLRRAAVVDGFESRRWTAMAQGKALRFRFLNLLLGPRAIVSSENSPIDSLVYARNCSKLRFCIGHMRRSGDDEF